MIFYRLFKSILFLLIEFYCTFSISCIIRPYYVYWYCILDFFFHSPFTSFHVHASLLTFVCFSVLFDSCCSHARVFGRALVHEFLISYSHTEWCLPLLARRNSPCFDQSFAYQNLIKLNLFVYSPLRGKNAIKSFCSLCIVIIIIFSLIFSKIFVIICVKIGILSVLCRVYFCYVIGMTTFLSVSWSRKCIRPRNVITGVYNYPMMRLHINQLVFFLSAVSSSLNIFFRVQSTNISALISLQGSYIP